jgi:hypothetical protein
MAGVAIFWHLVPPVLLAIVVLAGRGRSPIRHQAGNLQYRYDVQ